MIGSAVRLKDQAVAFGFNLIGVARAEPAPHLDAYFRWIGRGLHGQMSYLARPDRQARRRDLNIILPGVRSLVMVGLDYHTLRVPDAVANDPARGRIAAYAWGQDYHAILSEKLEQVADWLLSELGSDQISQRVYVDTGAILERDHAQQAGLGFIGKNTMLIHPRRGSDFFLGEILTTLEFDEYDQPGPDSLCGRCQRCLMGCPTNAFPEPYTLDARRCISYLTIEHKEAIDPALRPLMGNWVYGCDVCQAVCPWNRFAIETREPGFYPLDIDRAAPNLADLLRLDQAGFQVRFGGSAIERIKRDRLVRNACIAAGNSHLPELIPLLASLTADPNPVVSEAASWAHAQIERAAP